MRISDWSSDVCSSDLIYTVALLFAFGLVGLRLRQGYGELDRVNAELQKANVGLEKEVELRTGDLRKALEDLKMQQAQLIQSEKKIGRASCRERVGQYV